MTVPTRTPEQRAEALAKAHATRQEKARLREGLRTGAVQPADIIAGAAANPVWGSLRVTWLLAAMPGLGPVRVDRIMTDLGIAPSRRLQGLGERQRGALLATVQERT